jgi:hypothetical protein
MQNEKHPSTAEQVTQLCQELDAAPPQPYTGPERRAHPTEDPADTDPPVQHKPVHIPGAIWPDPAKSNFTLEGLDPYNRSLRESPPKRRVTDYRDDKE